MAWPTCSPTCCACRRRARLDYVLADPRLRLGNYTVTDNATVGRILSDHKPVTVDLIG